MAQNGLGLMRLARLSKLKAVVGIARSPCLNEADPGLGAAHNFASQD